jgi:ADP-ribose pyrophosphatase YjhB (NUDIX family)
MTGTYPEKIFKYCPKCSGEFIAQKDFSFICKACGLHFFSNACGAVCALITDIKGNLLLTKRAHDPQKDMLDLPGGFISPLESAEQAIKREILEELSVELTSCKYFCSFPNRYVYSGLTYFTIDLAFICTLSDFTAIKPADDVSEAILVQPADIDIESIAFESIRNVIKHFMDNNK